MDAGIYGCIGHRLLFGRLLTHVTKYGRSLGDVHPFVSDSRYTRSSLFSVSTTEKISQQPRSIYPDGLYTSGEEQDCRVGEDICTPWV